MWNVYDVVEHERAALGDEDIASTQEAQLECDVGDCTVLMPKLTTIDDGEEGFTSAHRTQMHKVQAQGKGASTAHADAQRKGAGAPKKETKQGLHQACSLDDGGMMLKEPKIVCSLCGAPEGPLCLLCSWEQQGPIRWITGK